MVVINILKDGTRLDNLDGHIVKIQDAEVVYELMDKIKKRRDTDEKNDKDT